ncbi:MAG TPA: multicopper oxidase domain-containing protein [Solirubrobacteraceae bacterium]|nr:multicopper oxidase domain-containing protein [Solirubrobacteraceae bacterium]
MRPGAATRRLAHAVLVTACAGLLAAPAVAEARTRHYWVAAEVRPWSVVPNGHDAISHEPVDARANRGDAIVYQRYSRRFRRKLPNGAGGLAGPLLRARVGDTIKIHFRNLDLERPHSMHFHGVHYKPSSDGAYLPGFSGRDGKVDPGESYTYVLRAKRDSVGAWPYHDHSPSMMESIENGMFGMLSIFGRREKLPDREFVVVFSHMRDLFTINGRAFVGNTPILRAKVGDLVQWNVMSLGSDFHTFHVHGHRWMQGRTPRDTRTVGPAESFRIRWRERHPGTWLYHCHVEDHMMNGMIGIYRVKRR